MNSVLTGYATKWISDSTDEDNPTAATNEAKRALGEILRCNNLIVLAGLGTSLSVETKSGKKAPTMRDLWESVSTRCSASGIKIREIISLVRFPGDVQDIEGLLSKCKAAESFLIDAELTLVKRFILCAELAIGAAVDFIEKGTDLPLHTQFLRKIARRSNRKTRTKIFTTNYDRCFEHAALIGRFAVIDGFSLTLPQTFDPVYFTYDYVRRDASGERHDLIANVFHLYKVHGSIDWTFDEEINRIVKTDKTEKPLLIYPRSNKYELAFSQPYLEMMAAFQSALREPNTGLIVVGFGFSDLHLAEPILSSLYSNLTLKVAIVGPQLAPAGTGDSSSLGEAKSNKYIRKIAGLAEQGDARLALINATFFDAVALLPDETAETELERHKERVRALAP